MASKSWMIYGAYGYTGKLIAEEAVQRGHRPILAGRSKEKLVQLADHLSLDWTVVDLSNRNALAKALEPVELVILAAGPFIYTSRPMIQACLKSGTSYMDITGEIPVFQQTFSFDQQARQQGIVLISGVGFDVIPSDCLAGYVSQQVPGAVELEIAFASLTRSSAGTMKSMLEMLPGGGLIRMNGKLVPYPLGQGQKQIRFLDKQRSVLPIPWGDLATAFHATRIPNITTYMTLPSHLISLIRLTGPLVQKTLAISIIKKFGKWWVDRLMRGPSEHQREQGRSQLWASARDHEGNQAQAWLETLEAYQFTAVASVRCAEKYFEGNLSGALTPAQAFGTDFVLEMEKNGQKTRRVTG